MVALTNHVIPEPDLYYARALAVWGFSQHFSAKYRGRTKKLPSEHGTLLALCHMVNPALVIALRS